MPNQCISPPANLQAPLVVARRKTERYALAVAANSATGFGDPSLRRRTGATISIAGAFFVPAFLLYGGCARETFGSAGFLLTRFANLRTAATFIRLATFRGSFHLRRSSTMYALNPSKIRAAAHRAMARAALHANSSLRSRLARYNSHMEKARALETTGGVK